MSAEIEATFIEIDKDELRAQLKALGATLKQPETLMRRVVFDLGPSSFARVRDEGDCITMSYKHLDSHTLSGMQEICLKINDYDAGLEFLQALGLKPKAHQESLREKWDYHGTEIDIDTWPWIPSFVEIEGPSEAAVKDAAAKLGFDMNNAIFGAVDEVYVHYYDTTCDAVNFAPEISFTNLPDWLDGKIRPEHQALIERTLAAQNIPR